MQIARAARHSEAQTGPADEAGLSQVSASNPIAVSTPMSTEYIERTFTPRDVPAGMKRCGRCNEVLPLERFNRRSGAAGYRSACRSCQSDDALRRYHLDPDKARAGYLRRAFGLTPEAFDELLTLQGGGCRICGSVPEVQKNRLHIDHDHATGAVRGILCHRCNVGLGWFNDNADALRAAAEYVEAGRG